MGTAPQVPRTKCRNVPEKKCQDFPINVARKECREFPRTVCTQDAIQVTVMRLVNGGIILSSSSSSFFKLYCFLLDSESNASQVTKQIPKKVCKARGSEKCISIPRQVTVDVPKSINKKVCRLLSFT